MSRVFLASANIATSPFPVYPLGMAVVARALSEAGHEVAQFDPLAEGLGPDILAERLRAFGPDVVGLSLRNIDNVDSFSGDRHWWVENARTMVQAVRGVTSAPVVLGGPGFSLLPGPVLDYVGADYGVVGEGERAACELVAALARGERPSRLYRAAGGAACAEEFCPPLLEDRLLRFYEEKTGLANYQTKRGCPHSCAYCTYPNLEGARFRVKDPKTVVDELAAMMREHGVREVFFTDSVFNDAPGRYLELAEEMLRRDLGLRWCAFFRPQGIGAGEVRLMKRAGLFAMEFGTDATSDATLAGLDKGFTFADAEAATRAALDERMPCAHYVIFGGPLETEETVEEGIGNLAGLGQSVVFAFSGIRILPGTPVAERAIREGVIGADDDLLRPVFYFSPHVDVGLMNQRVEEAFRGRRDRVFPPEEGQERMKVMHRFGFKGILWDRLLSFGKPPREAR
jgi:lipid biosynthesis B12-binding/radical SAM protein